MRAFCFVVMIGCGSRQPSAPVVTASATPIPSPPPASTIQHIQVTNVDHGRLFPVEASGGGCSSGGEPNVIIDVPDPAPHVRILLKSVGRTNHSLTGDTCVQAKHETLTFENPPGAHPVWVSDPPFAIAIIPDREPSDPLADLTPVPVGSERLIDRALPLRYPALTLDDADDVVVRERLLETAPLELFVYASQDLGHDAMALGIATRGPVKRPQRGEPLLWTGRYVITLDGDVFRVAPSELTIRPDTLFVPTKIRNERPASREDEARRAHVFDLARARFAR